MRKVILIVAIIICCFLGFKIFIGNPVASHKEKIHEWDKLYEIIAEDCLEFTKKGKYVTSLNPNDFSYDKLIEKIAEKDAVAGNSLYWVTWHSEIKPGFYEIEFRFKYYINKNEYKKVCKMAKDIAKELDGYSDYGKIKATHDYLIKYNNYHIGSDGPYRALYKGQTNCNGYALAFMAIMRECGIPCTYETGDNHAWNTVLLDGEWYNIDVTWDDTGVWDKEGGVLYDYFLKSNQDWKGHHHGNSTAKVSYAADLNFEKTIPNFDTIYTIKNIVIWVLIIVALIVANIIKNKITKKQTVIANTENVIVPMPSKIPTSSDEYNDITLGK